MNQLANKVIWITGATSGYGLALAKRFAMEGAKLILSARNKQALQEISQQIPQSQYLVLDLKQVSLFPQKIQDAISIYGHIDILINNGAIAQNGSVLKTELPVAREIMEVDYFAQTELTHYLLPHMIERKQGHIIAISGILAHMYLPGRSTYSAAKAALIAYFGCLRAELQADNIDVTILIPGMMQTTFASKALQSDGSITNTVTPIAGCPVEVAAEQSLQAILRKEYETYIGLDDDTFKLWQLSRSDANKGIALLLNRANSSK